MGRFDWADKGIVDISGISEEEFKSHFNSMTDEEKQAILDDLEDATEDAEAKKKALDFAERFTMIALRAIDALT